MKSNQFPCKITIVWKLSKILLFAVVLLSTHYTHAQIGNIVSSHASELPVIDIRMCRMANYLIEYDLMRSNSKVGHARRELIEAKNGSVFYLRSSLTASVAFMKFIHQEQSIYNDYRDIGLYSNEYSKSVKKPFKKKVTKTYEINNIKSEKSSKLLDSLSVYDHLRELVCSGLRTNITLNVQEENKVSQFNFEFKGEQSIQLPMGKVHTLLFVRTRKTSTRETFIWFSNTHFLPLKIQQVKNDETQALLVANSHESALLE